MSESEVLKQDYFKAGENWFYDQYAKAKWQARLFLLLVIVELIIIFVLGIATFSIFPLKTFIPIVVHQNHTTGEFWVKAPDLPYKPNHEAEVQADIVRYLIANLSYSAADIKHRYDLVLLLSDGEVQKQYADRESNDNPESPVNVLGATGSRTIKIEDIVFLGKASTENRRASHHDLAKVDLVSETTDKNGSKKKENWVATIAWVYKGTPQNQVDAWNNWNGFTVTSFRLDPKNISH